MKALCFYSHFQWIHIFWKSCCIHIVNILMSLLNAWSASVWAESDWFLYGSYCFLSIYVLLWYNDNGRLSFPSVSLSLCFIHTNRVEVRFSAVCCLDSTLRPNVVFLVFLDLRWMLCLPWHTAHAKIWVRRRLIQKSGSGSLTGIYK